LVVLVSDLSHGPANCQIGLANEEIEVRSFQRHRQFAPSESGLGRINSMIKQSRIGNSPMGPPLERVARFRVFVADFIIGVLCACLPSPAMCCLQVPQCEMRRSK
jgi:hypothetical protein